MTARFGSRTLSCPRCNSVNSFDAVQCASCGASLSTLASNADTVEVPPLERDPQIEELWDRLRKATLGEYDVYGLVGRGGMAAVFLALDLALEREVAIKVVSPDVLQTKSVVERFKREARTAASLSHPNIIPVHQVREVGGLVYFVMKYVSGRSLDSIIREQGAAEFDLVMSVLTQAGSALDFAHRKGVVHREVKPANIMVDEDGWVIVTDFGIAKVADSGALTSAGVIVGTPAYMSPEQFGSVVVTGSADQYSLGIVAYELLAGRVPFSATSIAEMMRAHLIDDVVPLSSVRADAPEQLSRVIMRMLEKDPARRWPSVGDAVAALEPLPRAREEVARAQLISLAKSGAQARPRISVPISPRMARPKPSLALHEPVDSLAVWYRVAIYATMVIAVAASWMWIVRLTSRSAQPAARGLQLAKTPSAAPNAPAPNAPAPDATAGNSAALSENRSRGSGAGKATPQRSGVGADRTGGGKRASAPSVDSSAGRSGARGVPGTVSPGTTKAPEAINAPSRGTESTGVVVPPAKVPVDSITPDGFVRIGSRIPNAVLYLDGKAQDRIGPLRYLALRPGAILIGVHADGCASWDTTITVVAHDTLRINYRNPVCSH